MSTTSPFSTSPGKHVSLGFVNRMNFVYSMVLSLLMLVRNQDTSPACDISFAAVNHYKQYCCCTMVYSLSRHYEVLFCNIFTMINWPTRFLLVAQPNCLITSPFIPALAPWSSHWTDGCINKSTKAQGVVLFSIKLHPPRSKLTSRHPFTKSTILTFGVAGWLNHHALTLHNLS